MSPRRFVLVVAIASVLAAGTVPGPAGAGPSEGVRCVFNPIAGVARVFLPKAGDFVWLRRERGGSAIYWGSKQRCGNATVRNTERIVIQGGPGYQDVLIDLSNGPLAPGRTAEADDRPEIEVTVDLEGGTDSLDVAFGGFRDRMVVGEAKATWNYDPDADLRWRDLEELTVTGAGGEDYLAAGGGKGTRLGITRLDLLFIGGSGRDVLIGGVRADLLSGNEGDDLLRGGPGPDHLDGGRGDDTLRGGRGDDRLDGGRGEDLCVQGPGTGHVGRCEA
jgi:hypothetical protein